MVHVASSLRSLVSRCMRERNITDCYEAPTLETPSLNLKQVRPIRTLRPIRSGVLGLFIFGPEDCISLLISALSATALASEVVYRLTDVMCFNSSYT